MTSTLFLKRIADLYDEFKQHDARQADRLRRFRNIEAESAKLLAMLVRTQQSQRILEIGTSTGYSTLWLAEAAKTVGGHVQTLEINAFRSAQPKQYAEEFSLEAYIAGYWNDLKRLISNKGGTLIIDNVISHPAEVKPLLDLIKNDELYMSTILPIGAGLCMVVTK